MEKLVNSEIDISLKGFPDDLVKLIMGLSDHKKYIGKHGTRNALVNMGKPIIPYMHKLLASKNDLIRKESAKVVELIADTKSIPFLINLLNDADPDIRWIAAEGLVKIGRRSIVPLLKSIRVGESSHLIGKGAHHVLHSLLTESEMDKLKPLMLSLDNYHQLAETAPIEAAKALKTVFKPKNSNS